MSFCIKISKKKKKKKKKKILLIIPLMESYFSSAYIRAILENKSVGKKTKHFFDSP